MKCMYLGKGLSRRTTAYFVERLGRVMGRTYFESSWSSPWAYIDSIINLIESYKQDSQKYHELKRILKHVVDAGK